MTLSGVRSLHGKVAAICGVGPGMGREIALALAREGADVALLARGEGCTASLAAEVRGLDVRADPIVADMTDANQCAQASDLIYDKFGRVDIVVTVAFRDDGAQRKSLLESSPDLVEWRRVFEINLFGTMMIVRALLPRMIQQRSGNIVFVNSMTSDRVLPKAAYYSGSKSALKRAAQCLALEVAPFGIRVNSLHPGYIWNAFVQDNAQARATANGTSLEDEVAKITSSIPLGYIPPPEEYARTVLYLASDMSAPMTGQSMHVNGGQFMP